MACQARPRALVCCSMVGRSTRRATSSVSPSGRCTISRSAPLSGRADQGQALAVGRDCPVGVQEGIVEPHVGDSSREGAVGIGDPDPAVTLEQDVWPVGVERRGSWNNCWFSSYHRSGCRWGSGGHGSGRNNLKRCACSRFVRDGSRSAGRYQYCKDE